MGNSCGGFCNREDGDPSEILTVENKVSPPSHLLLFHIADCLQYGKLNLTVKHMERFQRHVHRIVRIQALFRGALLRKRIAMHMQTANLHMEYMSGNKRVNEVITLTGDMQGQMIEERGDVVFKNGAVYKG